MNSNTSPPTAGDPGSGSQKTRVEIDDELVDLFGIYLSELRAFARKFKNFALSNIKIEFAMEAVEGKKLLKYMVANGLATSYFRDPQTRYRPTEFLLSRGGYGIKSKWCDVPGCGRVYDSPTFEQKICACGNSNLRLGHPFRAEEPSKDVGCSPTVTVRLHGQQRAPLKIRGQE